MVSKKKSEWPPPGWKVEIKVSSNGRHYKCYINSKTGEKFYSKLAVLRCVKKGKKSNPEYQSCATKQHPKTKTENNKMHLPEANDSLNLPPGWTLEWNVRQRGTAKGTKYKCITDPSTGSKFYSMPEVYRYLKSRKGCAESSKQAKGESITNPENNCNGVNLHSKRAVLRCIKKGKRSNRESQSHGTKQHPKSKTKNKKMRLLEANDYLNLPPGWTVEWKVRQNGAQKGIRYKCITDPSTGSKFYSMPEVYRYLKSKKRSAESSKQTKGEGIVNFQDNISVNNPMSPRQPNLKKELSDDSECTTIHDKLSSGKMKLTPFVNTEKTGKGSKRKHFIDEKSPKQSVLVPPLAAITNEAQSKRITRSSAKIQSVSSGLEDSFMVPAQPSGEVFTVEAQITRSTRSYSKVKSSSTCEPGIEKTVLVKPKGEVCVIEAKTKRSTQSSFKVESSPTCELNLDKIPLLSEPSETVQKMVPENLDEVYPIGAQIKRRTRSTKVHTTYICEPDIKKSSLLPGPAQGSGEIAPAECDSEVPSAGGQSKRRTRSTTKVKPPFTYEPNLEQMSLLPEPGKETLEILPAKLNVAVFGVEGIDDVGPEVHVANVKQNNADHEETEPSISLMHKSNVKVQRSSVRKTRVNKSAIKDRKMPILSSRSSKKLAEIDVEVLQKNANPRLDLVPNEPQQRTRTLDDDLLNVITSQQETSWAFDVNTPTLLHTQVNSLEKIEYIPQEYIEEILLQEDEGPPGFSHYPRAKITQSTIDQLFEDPFDTIPEDTIEKSPEKHVVLNDQGTPSMMKIDKSFEKSVLEEPTTLGTNDTHPGSQFCFSSPLWSDPCLEFAFKTLTGDLPLDDNMVTQGFMDHQLRTCDQVNNNNQRTLDIGMSRFFQNDETKSAPPLPDDDVGFTKPNGFNSHKPNR